MPGPARGHARAFYKGDDIRFWIGAFECAVIAMQVVKGDVENALCREPHARRVVTRGLFVYGVVNLLAKYLRLILIDYCDRRSRVNRS